MNKKEQEKKVNFFISGVNKSGTTYLYHLLNSHPQIFMSKIKELYYFSKEIPSPIIEYHTNFEFDNKYKYFGEATPIYYRSKRTIERIKAYSPEAKILIIVRDPVERIRSQFYYDKQLGNISENIKLEDIIYTSKSKYLSDSRYEKTLPFFEELFGKNLKIISLEETIKNTEKIWTELLTFLDVKQLPLPTFSKKNENATGNFLYRALYRSTIHKVKRKHPKLYTRLLRLQAMRISKKILLRVLGKEQNVSLSPQLNKELKETLKDTYQYLSIKGFKEYYPE